MANIYQEPLRQEHCDALDRVLQNCGPALEIARKCKACGWPVDNYIEQLEAQRRMATETKRLFFPTTP